LPPAKVGNQDHYHLAVSLIEDVTIGLCRFKALSIIAPYTAWQLGISGNQNVFQALAIDYVIETQIQNRGGEHWLSVKLVNAASREIVWTERYPFEQAQTARHYRELSVQIILALVDKIERAELSLYSGEQDATAYHLYLAGQRYLRSIDLPHVRRARRAFKEAVSHCPDFVPAISGQARTYHLEWLLMARGDSELLVEAEQLAKRSLEIDPDDARGYRELGLCKAYSGRYDDSLEALAEGEQRNPQFADLLNDFADALVHACEPAAALEKISRAIELNPLCPDQYWWAAAGANYQLSRYAEARNSLQNMRDQTPAFRLMAASCAMLGEKDQAKEYARKTREVHPDFLVQSWLSVMPFRDKEVMENYEQGLRLAGFD
jgi:tetratricopeptide (TPR) repeat protein